jgi:hypothetical protein
MKRVPCEDHLYRDTRCREPLLDVLCAVHTYKVSGRCDRKFSG